jgi:hypothetical protein
MNSWLWSSLSAALNVAEYVFCNPASHPTSQRSLTCSGSLAPALTMAQCRRMRSVIITPRLLPLGPRSLLSMLHVASFWQP